MTIDYSYFQAFLCSKRKNFFRLWEVGGGGGGGGGYVCQAMPHLHPILALIILKEKGGLTVLGVDYPLL